MAARKRGLGRGLDALLGASSAAATDARTDGTADAGISHDGEMRDIPIDLIQRGKYQPRRDIDNEALEELANSIRAQGVMQPIVFYGANGQN